MKKVIFGIFACILLIMLIFLPTFGISKNIKKENILPSINDRPHVIIFIDTDAIDHLEELNQTEKAQLKAALIAHIWANFNESVGSGNVTVTNDPSQASDASRIINLVNTIGGTRYILPDGTSFVKLVYGVWEHRSPYLDVFLRNFIRVDGDKYKTNGVWNITKLANGIGRTAAHEVAHSYCVGHNNRSENQSKMTDGNLVSADDRPITEWHFDNHTSETLRNNWGRPPCSTATDYDEEALVINYEGPDYIENSACEIESVDAILSFEGELAYFFELGWRGEDTDNGELDGNPYFDFIYKTSMTFNPDIDAEEITFLLGNSGKAQFLLRGAPGSPWQGQWFPLINENVVLSNFITDPFGEQIARNVLMMWDIDYDHNPDVLVNLNSLCYGDLSNPYNGFKYEQVLPNNPPEAPTKPEGETSGKPGIVYTYSFSAVDADGDSLMFYIDWGDDSDSLWFGPFDSGEEATAEHAWAEKGTYNVRARCKDKNFVESDWSEPLTVIMPRNRAMKMSLLNFLVQYPILYQLLKRFLQI